MRTGALAAALWLAACGFNESPPLTGDAAAPDAGKLPDSDNGDPCYGPTGWDVCLPVVPTGTRPLDGDIDTDTDSRCLLTQPATWVNAGQLASCFIVGGTITVSNVTAHGNRPLVLLADDSITIAGSLDVSSHIDGNRGPGPDETCPFEESPESSSGFGGGGGGSGGGAGGTFRSKGGDGGTGDGGQAKRGEATAPTTAPDKLRRGCPGQRGAGGGGTVGDGGGAVYLLARNTIGGAGTINASGAGAKNNNGGGSGGGSGGMIVLFAETIIVARLVANGGGGSGASGGGGNQDGSDPDPAMPMMPADGGGGGPGGGGRGHASTTNPTNGAGAPGGESGGGGGGGGGYIRANAAPSGIVSPPASIIP